MKKPFSAYRGSDPFTFVCYAHEDADLVYAELAWLHDKQVNLWYDEGIAAGRNWRAEIGDSLLRAHKVLFFISRNSLGSDHCNREINLALDEGKEIVPVYLEDVPLTPDLKVGLNRVQALRRDADPDFARQLLEALAGDVGEGGKIAEPTQRLSPTRKWTIAATAGILAIASAAMWLDRKPGDTGTAEDANEAQASVVDSETSVAVLPFVNMSADPEQVYFSDGLAEELINLLTRNPDLKVISRSSSFAFRGQDLGAAKIARQLKVKHLLEGSVRKAGNTVRVTAMLTDAASGTLLWSERFDRSLDDIFSIQEEIAASVASRLNTTLLALDQRSRTSNTDAYLLYLRARHLLGLAGGSSLLLEAEDLLNAALAADPGYVPALTEMARVQTRKGGLGLLSPEASARIAKSLTVKALDINPDDPVANAWRGWQSLFHEDDPEQAARFYERALELDRLHRDVLRGLVPVLMVFDRNDEALALAEFVVEIDPLCVVCITNLAESYHLAGRLAEAEVQWRQALALNPSAFWHEKLGQLLLEQGRLAEARAEFEQLDPTSSATQAALAGLLLAEGKTAAFAAAFDDFRRRWPEERTRIASLYAFSGDADRAFQLLQEILDAGSGESQPLEGMPVPLAWRAHVDDPRWQAYLEKVGINPERYATIAFEPSLPPGARPLTPSED